jgi:hypothetical protein
VTGFGRHLFGLSHQEAPQENAEAQAQEDAQEDEVGAPV